MWGGLRGFATLLLGIIIVVINKNGQKTVIDVPDSSTVSVAPDGTISVEASQENLTSSASNETGLLTAFPAGAVYKGTFQNFDQNGNQIAESELTVTIKRRSGDNYESNWQLHHWNHHWYAVGTVDTPSDAVATAEGEFTDLAGESHPNEGGNAMSITFSEDLTSFTGVKRQLQGVNAGRWNKFEAKLVNAINLKLAVDPLHFGAKWKGVLTADPGTGPIVSQTTASITDRTADGFTMETQTVHTLDGDTFSWRYKFVAADNSKFKVEEAELLQKTRSFTEDVGFKLINSSIAKYSDRTLDIVMSRPVPAGRC